METKASEHEETYSRQAGRYERLVSREDYQGQILPALEQIVPLCGADTVELGAGTGRLTRMLAPLVRRIYAFDVSAHMLRVAGAILRESGLANWRIAVADYRTLPTRGRIADLVIAGWSVCYAVVWHPASWRRELGRALGEARRVLRPAGTIVLLETLGAGFETPHPPNELRAYYALLEREGFESTWIRTDYRFTSLAEAESLTRFFFGDGLAQQVVENRWLVLPECTGVWWMRV